MASRGLIHHAQTAPAFIRRAALDYELSDDQELASSQPVSLIQLCTRTNSSRIKAAKRGRDFHSAGADVLERVPTLPVTDRHEHWPRLPLPDYSSPAEYGQGVLAHPNPSSRFASQEYPWERDGCHLGVSHEQQAWHPDHDDYHKQNNPLNYATIYNGSQSRESSYVSRSPFLRKSDWLQSFPEHRSGSVDMTPITKQTLVGTPQSYSYAQRAHRSECVPASSLQLYRDSYDHPSDISLYESFRLKQRPNRTDLPEIKSGLLFGGPPEGNDVHPADTVNIATHSRQRQVALGTASHLPGDGKLDRSQNLSSHGSRLSSDTSISQQTLKEEICAILENMTLNAKANVESTAAPSSVGQKPGTTKTRELDQGDQGSSMSTDEHKEQGPVNGDSIKTAIEHKNDTALPQPGQPQTELNTTLESAPGQPLSTSGASPKKIVYPPPGLSEPEKPSSSMRLHDIQHWFHRDARGEEQLRGLVYKISENFVPRAERLSGHPYSEQDRLFAKQSILLLGNAIANLRAYKSGNELRSTDYFARFEPAPSRYCEQASGKQHSYFDF